jgi:hypothetical protein
VELDDGTQGDRDGQSEDQVFQLGKEEREKQKSMEIKAKVLIVIFVSPIKTPERVRLGLG